MRKIKEKQCKHCGTMENLRINKNGVIYNCCVRCYKEIEIPSQMKLTSEAIMKKYGVSNLGELKQKRAEENPKKQKEKKIQQCKYCGSLNIITKQGEKRIISFPACKDHWELYQQEKNEVRKQTNLEKFGSDHPMHVKELAEKQKQTIHNRTDAEKQNIWEKRKKTNLERYGSESPIRLEEFNEKRKKTYIEKYGVDNPAKNKDIQEKAIKTFRYGYWNTFVELLKQKKLEPCFNLNTYINKDILTYKCLRCNKIIESTGKEPQSIWCGCNQHRSKYEDEIIDWLKFVSNIEIESNKKFREHDRIIFEIDVYLPQYKIGIDFHGLYWHSNISVRKTYHQEKYLYFKEQDIQLIQIFESEWLSHSSIVRSIIKNKLGLNKTIYARMCEIREMPTKESKEFLELNHLQGYATASLNIGLYCNNELVCTGSFGKDRFSKEQGTFELIRFANKVDTSVVGGFQRIIKYFETTYNPEKIISYIDVRYFNGSGYLKSGFSRESLTQPNYFYFKSQSPEILYNRMKFQKHKLSALLDNFNPAISESDNMYNNGFLRIYDAGNLKVSKLK